MQRRLQEQQEDVKGHEELILMQRREIEALLAKRSREETEADELHRQARELTTELRSCRRSCGSLESEIASEEARAAALREAFEGRRARFATAETAARNAELSTMRATRRRIAAEIMARRETEAVQEAQGLRQEYRARAEAHCEVITSEIAEVRTNDLFKGHNSVNQAEATSASEEAEAEAASREMSELQAAIFTLEQQTAVRESELHAMQRRKLRGSSKRRDGSGSRTPTTATQDRRIPSKPPCRRLSCAWRKAAKESRSCASSSSAWASHGGRRGSGGLECVGPCAGVSPRGGRGPGSLGAKTSRARGQRRRQTEGETPGGNGARGHEP
ncbi:unnamed protein product [Effrenium voratum]|uniref:Uncharacterized protein n=1 Tax=Effrenium voratum TaxID=2562239 RepID=A0AA36N5G2_9DINO|nr:unnamed protein product [Effrenium voratum]CAJ1454946.1 unnamed protein product [Effrenium voratum]